MSILKLKPTGKDYLWGGTRLAEEYGKEMSGSILAETWELSCHPDGPSYIADGPYTGLTLAQYVETQGKKVLGMELGASYEGIYTSGEDIVCYDSGQLTIYNIKGKKKFEAGIAKNVRAVFRVDDGTKYILIGDETADIIRLQQSE